MKGVYLCVCAGEMRLYGVICGVFVVILYSSAERAFVAGEINSRYQRALLRAAGEPREREGKQRALFLMRAASSFSKKFPPSAKFI